MVCEKCGGYYELNEGESPEDFDRCQCGGKLKYCKILPDFTNFDLYETKHVKRDKEELDHELELYQSINLQNTNKNNIDSLNLEKEIENEYMPEQIANHRDSNPSFTTKLGSYSLNYPFRVNPYLGAVAILIVIPIILSFVGKIGFILTPLVILSFIFIIDKFFNESVDYAEVFSDTVFFIFSFSIPAFAFLIIPASNEFGSITALMLFFSSIMAILLGQLISIRFKTQDFGRRI